MRHGLFRRFLIHVGVLFFIPLFIATGVAESTSPFCADANCTATRQTFKSICDYIVREKAPSLPSMSVAITCAIWSRDMRFSAIAAIWTPPLRMATICCRSKCRTDSGPPATDRSISRIREARSDFSSSSTNMSTSSSEENISMPSSDTRTRCSTTA